MKKENKELWEKIKNFEIDDEDSDFTFTDRLARENGWSLEFSLRTIYEYKKFIFLIIATNTPQTPSDQVDQVWHLHLIYTKSYWVDLCKNTLQRDIHHGPTKGGKNEKTKYRNLYNDTLENYKSFFGEFPPKDIWPSEYIRFKEINFTRINRHRNWVIPKFNIKQ